MRLIEVFDAPAKSVHNTAFGNNIETHSAKLSDNTKVHVSFFHIEDYTDQNCWALTFSRVSANNPGGSLEKTGEGNEIEVMSTVMSVVKQFVQKRDPTLIEFSADVSDDERKHSRLNLYTKIVNRFASGTGYNVERQFDGEAMIFQILKKGVQLEWLPNR